MEIDVSLFPAPESPYSYLHSEKMALSILALHLQLVKEGTNLLPNLQPKGHYFFRNAGIPEPRPCTILAWNAICRLGIPGSAFFYVPFLPSLREDDEMGVVISEKGSRIPSLSRKSNLHQKDEEGRITWGSVFIANTDATDWIVEQAIERSNVAESLVTPRQAMWGKSAQEPLRLRMEFLAQHGFVASNPAVRELGIPRIHRLLFQMTTHVFAEQWAKAFMSANALIVADPKQIDADFKDMIEGWRRESQATKETESENQVDETGKGKNLRKAGRFGDLTGISFDL